MYSRPCFTTSAESVWQIDCRSLSPGLFSRFQVSINCSFDRGTPLIQILLEDCVKRNSLHFTSLRHLYDLICDESINKTASIVETLSLINVSLLHDLRLQIGFCWTKLINSYFPISSSSQNLKTYDPISEMQTIIPLTQRGNNPVTQTICSAADTLPIWRPSSTTSQPCRWWVCHISDRSHQHYHTVTFNWYANLFWNSQCQRNDDLWGLP
jgi:hypothetical protein